MSGRLDIQAWFLRPNDPAAGYLLVQLCTAGLALIGLGILSLPTGTLYLRNIPLRRDRLELRPLRQEPLEEAVAKWGPYYEDPKTRYFIGLVGQYSLLLNGNFVAQVEVRARSNHNIRADERLTH